MSELRSTAGADYRLESFCGGDPIRMVGRQLLLVDLHGTAEILLCRTQIASLQLRRG